MAQFSLLPSSEAAELADDIRLLFDDIARSRPREQRPISGECRPALDVRETDDVLEITVDVAGIPRESLRVLFRSGVVLVVGEKPPSITVGGQTYHLVEREFGRFARAVRVAGAFNIPKAHATLHDGELIIVLPKLVDRRGAPHPIRIDGPATAPS
jgi:HSP20 family protein